MALVLQSSTKATSCGSPNIGNLGDARTELRDCISETNAASTQWQSQATAFGDQPVFQNMDNWYSTNIASQYDEGSNQVFPAADGEYHNAHAKLLTLGEAMDGMSERLTTMAKTIGDEKAASHMPGSPQANWKRKVKRAVADLKNVALNTKVEAKTVERRFTANLNGAIHQMNQSFSLKLSAAKAKATRAQAILSRKYESMLEKIRDSYAELGGTGQSNAQKAEALDLAEQVASLQTISVSMLSEMSDTIAEMYLTTTSEMNSMRTSFGKVSRDSDRALDRTIRGGLSSIKIAQTKGEKDARKFKKESDRTVAKFKTQFKNELKRMSEASDGKLTELGRSVQDVERRGFQLQSKGEQMSEENPAAETESVVSEGLTAIKDAGRMGEEEGKAEKTLSKKSVRNAAIALEGVTETFKPTVESQARALVNSMAEEIGNWVNVGKADEMRLEHELAVLLEGMTPQWNDLEDKLDKQRAVAEKDVGQVAKATARTTASEATAQRALSNRTDELNGTMQRDFGKLAASVQSLLTAAQLASETITNQSDRFTNTTGDTMAAKVKAWEENNTVQAENLGFYLRTDMTDAEPVFSEVESNRSVVEQMLNSIAQVTLHNLLAQIDEFSSTAKLKSLSAEELVRRDVKELGKNVTDYATSIENRFRNRVQNFKIDVGNKLEDLKETQSNDTDTESRRLDEIAAEYEAERKSLRSRRWTHDRVAKKEERGMKQLRQTTRGQIEALGTRLETLATMARDAFAQSMNTTAKLREHLLHEADATILPLAAQTETDLSDNVTQSEQGFENLVGTQRADTQKLIDHSRNAAKTADAVLDRFGKHLQQAQTDFSHEELASASLAQDLYNKVSGQEAKLKAAVAAAKQEAAKFTYELKKDADGLQSSFQQQMGDASHKADHDWTAAEDSAGAATRGVGEQLDAFSATAQHADMLRDIDSWVHGIRHDAQGLSGEVADSRSEARHDITVLAKTGSSASGDLKAAHTAQTVAEGQALGAGGEQLTGAISAAEVVTGVASDLPRTFGGLISGSDDQWSKRVNAMHSYADEYFNSTESFVHGMQEAGAAAGQAAAGLSRQLAHAKTATRTELKDKQSTMNALSKSMDERLQLEGSTLMDNLKEVTRESGVVAGRVGEKTLELASSFEDVLKKMQKTVEIVPIQLQEHKKAMQELINLESHTDASAVTEMAQAVDLLAAEQGSKGAWLHRLGAGQRAFKRVVAKKLAELGVDTRGLEVAENKVKSSMRTTLTDSEDGVLRSSKQQMTAVEKKIQKEVQAVYAEADAEIAAILRDQSKSQEERDTLVAQIQERARAEVGAAMAREAAMRQEEDHVKESLLKYERLVDEKKRALDDKIRQGMISPSAAAIHDKMATVSKSLERLRLLSAMQARRAADEAASRAAPVSLAQVSPGEQWAQLKGLQDLNAELREQDHRLAERVAELEQQREKPHSGA
jgi:hypothetical protein